MSSLFTITFMSVVRYLSVVCLQRTWHLRTNKKYWSSKLIWLLWGLSFLFAAPPLVGLGQYQKDLSKFSWVKTILCRVTIQWFFYFKYEIKMKTYKCWGVIFELQLRSKLVGLFPIRCLLQLGSDLSWFFVTYLYHYLF